MTLNAIVEQQTGGRIQHRANLLMVRFLAINLFMAIMVFASAGFALQSIRASHEAALWDDIATQIELNRIQLKNLKGELDQLERQECFVSKSLSMCYEYLDVCSTWVTGG